MAFTKTDSCQLSISAVIYSEQSLGDETGVSPISQMKHLFIFLAWVGLSHAQVKTQNEPTNAAEAAAKKAAADKVIDEKYQVLKAKLPEDQQAWETVLEQNLGSFYLPIHKTEKVAGRSNAWDFVKDDPKLPRVLLIGDSISRGYTQEVRKAMTGKANVHRAPENCGPTANGLKKIEVWLGDGRWDAIHFNFGIHDRKTSAADYEMRLETLIARMKQTGAKILFATTTPVPPDTKDGPEIVAQIAEKNEIAGRVMQEHSIVINDLHAFLSPQLEGIANPKDVHFNTKGYELMGQRVAKAIEAVLK
jgi:GDSL-like Lipase/Acylhydrolase family